MAAPLLTLADLLEWRAARRDFVLIDTALPEDFQAAHLPGAQNACVFDVQFLEQVAKLKGLKTGLLTMVTGTPEPHRECIIVYGASARSLASATAAEKLLAAGYHAVRDFRGGLEAWLDATQPVEGQAAPPPAPALEDRAYRIDLKTSKILWTGRSLTGRHHGTLDLSAGEVVILGGVVAGGAFTLEMTSLACTDLSDGALREVLHAHLRSEDFFAVEKFPKARFNIAAVDFIRGSTPGAPNHQVRGSLLLRGVAQDVEFPACVGFSPTDNRLTATANFDIDRTRWGVLYGSGRFYEKLGKHLVQDMISLEMRIVAD